MTSTGTDVNGNYTGTIVGQPNDPVADFRINVPSNTGSSTLDGWEFNVQHVFGESGFGLSANYTIVDGDIETGVMATGVVGGRIADVPSCQELVDRIMAEARARLDALAG